MPLSSVSWHRTGTTTEDPEFPAIFVMGLPKATAVREHPSDRFVPVEAFLTDSFPANSGGSACPSPERCVVGSRDLIAARSVVGSQLSYSVTPSLARSATLAENRNINS